MSADIRLLKSSYFTFEHDGDEIPTVTDIELPEQRIEQITHDNGNPDPVQETQGRLLFGDLVVHRDIKADMSTKLYDEHDLAATTGDTSAIKKPLTIFIKDQESTTISTLKFTGTWVKEYHPPTLCAMRSDTATEMFVISVDYMEEE
ncbi:hypothetical protein EA462_14235 [Natrarchaeobius halalkaliphilus]|uniref:Uncharacterized protein n=1 Tax=Natrarchaeobius halalkaliphilus TaxID=1679091 RepID=A0A3N6NVU1_9EURY|nr:phage tail protein [Natrarchaeobius halalkaliphilus]RQG88012.1 hypothetical protein EA462_14235 [Natrarchaeobius halalkaliphilus]